MLPQAAGGRGYDAAVTHAMAGSMVALALGGCSLVYDPDAIAGERGTVVLRSASELVEGAGCAAEGCDGVCTAAGCPGGRRAALLVLESAVEGPIAIESANVAGEPVPVDLLGTSREGDAAAVAIRFPVRRSLGPGVHRGALRVRDAAGDEAIVRFDVIGLDELVLDGDEAPAAARYATIEVTGDARPVLAGPLRLAATSDITIAARLSVSATPAGPGPGGCRGAANADDVAQCRPGGGRNSTTALPGGGGSFGTRGRDDGGAATPGQVTGTADLVPFGRDGNTGNGGGAHLQDPGGHGGGAIELVAGGALRIRGGGAIEASGGDAPAPAGGVPGGDGSGGPILLRATAGLEPIALETRILARGGGALGATHGLGRVRIDAPDELVGARPWLSEPRTFLGPAWIAAPLAIAGTGPETFALRGEPAHPFAVTVDGGDAGTCTPDAAGRGTIALRFRGGLHRVCALASPAASHRALAENASCIDVVSLP